MNHAAMNLLVQLFIWTYAFIFPGYMPRSEIAGSCVNLMVSVLRNCQIVFASGCTILHSRHPCTRIVVSPHLSFTRVGTLASDSSLRAPGPSRGCWWASLGSRDALSPCFSRCSFCHSFLGTQLGVSSCLEKCRKSSPDAGRQPFSGKSFYLDLPAGKSLQFLTGAIQQLGGVRNLLLTCDVLCSCGL